jgi:hypothetical protein
LSSARRGSQLGILLATRRLDGRNFFRVVARWLKFAVWVPRAQLLSRDVERVKQ